MSETIDVASSSSRNSSHGPVEVFLVALPGASPDGAVLDAIAALVAEDTIQVVDLVVVAKDPSGDLSITEYGDLSAESDRPDLGLVMDGLLAEEDITDLAADLRPGTSAAVFVIEHLWARTLAARLQSSGGEVLVTERIPAPVVNELVAILQD